MDGVVYVGLALRECCVGCRSFELRCPVASVGCEGFGVRLVREVFGPEVAMALFALLVAFLILFVLPNS